MGSYLADCIDVNMSEVTCIVTFRCPLITKVSYTKGLIN